LDWNTRKWFKKLLMQNFKKTFYAFAVLCFISPVSSKGFNINVTLDSEIYLESQKIFIEKLGELKTKSDIKDLLEEQDWIDEYFLKFKPFSGSAKLNIKTRTPIFILNDEFFVDTNLKKFKYDKSLLNLIVVNGPIEDLREPLNIINFFKVNDFDNINLKKLTFSNISGWQIQTNTHIIMIGNKVSNNKFNTLKDTLNYLYENRKIPSMIDLRYKDGVALDYGK
jgi:hypothetical protein